MRILDLAKSTNIGLAHYREEDEVLLVEFARNGMIYKYFNVPEDVVIGWELSCKLPNPSTGKYFNEVIKDRFEYQKLTEGY